MSSEVSNFDRVERILKEDFQNGSLQLPKNYGGFSAIRTITSLVLSVRDCFSPGYKADFIYQKVLETAISNRKIEDHNEIKNLLQNNVTSLSLVHLIKTPSKTNRIASNFFKFLERATPSKPNQTIPSKNSDNLKKLNLKMKELNPSDQSLITEVLSRKAHLSPDYFNFCLSLIANHKGEPTQLKELLQDPLFPLRSSLTIEVENEPEDVTNAFNEKIKHLSGSQKQAILLTLPELSRSSPESYPKNLKKHLSHLIDKTANISPEINTIEKLRDYLITTHLSSSCLPLTSSPNFNRFFTNFTFLTEEAPHSTSSRSSELNKNPFKDAILKIFLELPQDLESAGEPPNKYLELCWTILSKMTPPKSEPNRDFREICWKTLLQGGAIPSNLTDRTFLVNYVNESGVGNDNFNIPKFTLLVTQGIPSELALNWLKTPPTKVTKDDFFSSPKMTNPPKSEEEALKAFIGNYGKWPPGSKIFFKPTDPKADLNGAKSEQDIKSDISKYGIIDKQLTTTLFALSMNSTGLFDVAAAALDLQNAHQIPYTFSITKTGSDVEIVIDSTSPPKEPTEDLPKVTCHMKIVIKQDGSHEVSEFSVTKQQATGAI